MCLSLCSCVSLNLLSLTPCWKACLSYNHGLCSNLACNIAFCFGKHNFKLAVRNHDNIVLVEPFMEQDIMIDS